MDQKTYLAERIDDQINWYGKKSKTFQTRYKTLKVAVIIGSVTIPFLVGMIENGTSHLKIIVGIIGVVIAAIEGILSLYKYQELWMQYRLTAEVLNREKIIFLTKSGIYENDETPFNTFVNRAEAIMNSENISWQTLQQQKEKKS